jgi:hypothetical protein
VDRLQSSESIEVHTVYPVTAHRRILQAIATRRDLSSTKLAHRIVTFPVWNTGNDWITFAHNYDVAIETLHFGVLHAIEDIRAIFLALMFLNVL